MFWRFGKMKDSFNSLLERAAHGEAEAQFQLGDMYDYGRDIPTDDSRAFQYYSMAAEQGHREALFMLGCLFDEGRGTPKDKVKAIELWYEAGKLGHEVAQEALGDLFLKGQAIPQDVQDFQWLLEAEVRKQLKEETKDFPGFCFVLDWALKGSKMAQKFLEEYLLRGPSRIKEIFERRH